MSFEAVSKQVNLELIKSIACLSEEEQAFKDKRDQELRDVITGKDQRFLLVIGPCSADNEEAVLEYAKKLAAIQEKVKDKIFIVQRVYTGKPRTNGDGYKGMLHQQDPNGETNLIRGMVAVRKLHKRVIVEAGLTTADEMLYPENLVFVDDLVSYHAVGARSVEDQQHRFVASGIDAPTGLKNPTSGNMKVLFNSLHAAQRSQEFIFSGSEVKTSGNELAHVILRGALSEQGQVIPNYHYEDLLKAVKAYKADDYQNPFIIVDTNHDNSGKQYLEQIRIVKEVLINRAWNEDIKQMVRGFMIESYLEDGRQDISEGTYGKSITDPCLGWDKTEELIQYIYENI
ncbi:3-deoxy-7-phosphoheptulonate synthase [Enterococcus cecorum]|uniref:Phospho-2-dehydro-3-deoxyheptonate aldolase n=1 Tax=Enterococcus cecorum TaxID=44008 RepID=A0AAW8TRU9_9ENTE|nr:3-deoxy-7-phosphoheptulonate synthase [Enterococcus cecorum]KLO68232.1 phospho-2-dehydro-3-deoxyheptonate aldolase [Enterococcus cecorum]KLO73631.1 phospho-2-dehydro-3-deoxyheptonate aldolase [Enterococcus cecorum]MCJ0571389.1 3-deoxy-7-phosphoheptulonate synthase [Enterococcus cecorum]MCJ0577334.1 3-deoxy-7-phosphoheptulonate synthase [Enterococcus cecorum]MCJ0580850.1 3-deoxy-7-phosphoheptulonate synthase [Enterococcus cecorum]